MQTIADRIRHIPAVSETLSADVFIIEGDTRYYVYDAGASEAAYEAIAALDKPVTVILSHFHRDHIANLSRLTPDQILAGARTMKYVAGGTLVDKPLTIRDGITLEILPCVSPHAPGSLIVTVDSLYTFIGDLIYARPGTGQGEAKGMLRVLKSLQTQVFVPSHRAGNPLMEKAALLKEVKENFQI